MLGPSGTSTNFYLQVTLNGTSATATRTPASATPSCSPLPIPPQLNIATISDDGATTTRSVPLNQYIYVAWVASRPNPSRVLVNSTSGNPDIKLGISASTAAGVMTQVYASSSFGPDIITVASAENWFSGPHAAYYLQVNGQTASNCTIQVVYDAPCGHLQPHPVCTLQLLLRLHLRRWYQPILSQAHPSQPPSTHRVLVTATINTQSSAYYRLLFTSGSNIYVSAVALSGDSG